MTAQSNNNVLCTVVNTTANTNTGNKELRNLFR